MTGFVLAQGTHQTGCEVAEPNLCIDVQPGLDHGTLCKGAIAEAESFVLAALSRFLRHMMLVPMHYRFLLEGQSVCGPAAAERSSF